MGQQGWTHWVHKRKWEMRLAVVVTLAVGILLGTLISDGVRAARDNPTPAGAQTLTVASPRQLSSIFAEVAKKLEPTVVNISTESYRNTQRRRARPRQRTPWPFEDFFDFDSGRPQTERSLGSGVIVDPDGYILTNYHVVYGAGKIADRIRVDLYGENESYDAEVVGWDQETDLAVIKIDVGRKLPAAKLGDSDAVQVGDWVLAIGSPFGLSATVTAGIISYKGRSGQRISGSSSQFQRFIQTDAAINRGNSGGPLVNLAGEVIGINTAIMSRNGVSAGVGFALPSSLAVRVYNQIVEHGRVVRGSIGIEFSSADSENKAILRSFGADHGVIINNVRPASPAEKAGLQVHDVITHVGGTPIHTGDELVDKVTSTPVGQEVKIRYLRDEKERVTTAVVEDFSKIYAERYVDSLTPERAQEASVELGLTLEEVSPAMARRSGLEEEDVGLLVAEVEPGSFADEIRMLRGDLILEVNRKRVLTLREFRAVQRKLGPGSDVVFWVMRRGRRDWVRLRLGGTLPE